MRKTLTGILIAGAFLGVLLFPSSLSDETKYTEPENFEENYEQLDKPVYENQFGSHKTWRGIIGASLMGLFIFWPPRYRCN